MEENQQSKKSPKQTVINMPGDQYDNTRDDRDLNGYNRLTFGAIVGNVSPRNLPDKYHVIDYLIISN